MREIKFRVWDGERMIYESIQDEYDDYYMMNLQGEFFGHTRTGDEWFYYDKDETNKIDFKLMQYTGLKDKNGKEIYEGDIINFHYFFGTLGEGLGFVECEHELKGSVEWGEFGWGVSAIKGEHWKGYTGYDDGDGESSFIDLMMMNESSIHEESFEIIGNIHQDSLTNKEKK